MTYTISTMISRLPALSGKITGYLTGYAFIDKYGHCIIIVYGETKRDLIINKLNSMKPSNFISYPYSSILEKAEAETVALNIMKILKRTGDKFRKLGFNEYKSERIKDGNYSDIEELYFKQVVNHCKSEKRALGFCKNWCKIN